jgi:hypothetical protein
VAGRRHGYDFPGGVSVGSHAAAVTNVKFVGCRFHGTAVGGALVVVFGSGFTFDYCSFEPGAAAPPVPYAQSYEYGIEADGGYYSFAGTLNVMHSDFWGFGNAIDVGGSTQANPHSFSDNWIHDASNDGGGQYHTDGIGTLDGATEEYVTIHHNTIVSVGNTNGLAFQDPGKFNFFTVTDNYFSGFGYTVNLGGYSIGQGMVFTGNTFGTDIKPTYGPLYNAGSWQKGGLGNLWQNNRWHVVPGSYYSPASDDGKYWWPDGTLSTSDYKNP